MNAQEPMGKSPTPPLETRGVKALLGDPKKAIVKLALPMVLAMFLTSVYNLTDRFWVAGLGESALSATGYYFPLMMLALAFATGLGVGGSAAVSHFIGARRADKASSAAQHTLIIGLALSLVFTVSFMLLARQIFTLMGAGRALDDAVAYGVIMFGGTVFLFFTNIATALLRGEGSAVKAMISIGAGAILNFVLDPLFIFWFRMGVAGAAWASVLTMALSSVPLVYWLFFSKKRYAHLRFRGFRFERGILGTLANVGIPATLMQASMAVQMFIITVILAAIGGDRAVAVFTSGWTVVSIALLPLIGLGTAVTSVSAASLGARAFRNIRVVHWFSILLGLGIELVIALATGLGAPVIAGLFAWAPETRALVPDITGFLRVIWIFYPATAGGLLSSALFQGLRRGLFSLIITIFRTIVFAVPFAYLLGIAAGWGAPGVYGGLIIASWLSSIISFTWASLYIRKLNRNTVEAPPAASKTADAPAVVPAPETEE